MAYSNLIPTPSLDPSGADSPSSSVFDLPTQLDRLQRPTPIVTPPHIPGETSGSGDKCCEGAGQDGTCPSYLVVSGGTGCNSICSAFGNACYVLPVSDDGGSSSEIIRVLGGPSIGESPGLDALGPSLTGLCV